MKKLCLLLTFCLVLFTSVYAGRTDSYLPEARAETTEDSAGLNESETAGIPEKADDETLVSAAPDEVQTDVREISKHGNVFLKITGNALADLGYQFGDVLSVIIGGQTYPVPLCSDYSEVDAGNMVCKMVLSDEPEKSFLSLAINGDSFAEKTGLAVKEKTDKEPGYIWLFNTFPEGQEGITISLSEKGGYRDEYMVRNLKRSLDRADYPDETDEQYANFRMVSSSGIAPYVLYRSSSPVDPALNRNREADAALGNAAVAAVINLCNSEETMKAYPDYAQTFYSCCSIFAQELPTNYLSKEFEQGMAAAVRFIAAQEGPYLIHCKEGRDRAGFMCALLECLMGADAQQVSEDYMQTYSNFYGIHKGEERYETILHKVFGLPFSKALGIEDFTVENDLSACAAAYLKRIGLTEDEIHAVREHLSKVP